MMERCETVHTDHSPLHASITPSIHVHGHFVEPHHQVRRTSGTSSHRTFGDSVPLSVTATMARGQTTSDRSSRSSRAASAEVSLAFHRPSDKAVRT